VSAAIALAMSEPMGPVHLDLPEDVALAPATKRSPAGRPRSLTRRRIRDCARGGADRRRQAAESRCSVRRAMRVADPSLLRKVIERHSLPFATTTMAKG
jgi:thiamine pyrophosphate-dependent acetolactate synthase large subunit-like protein